MANNLSQIKIGTTTYNLRDVDGGNNMTFKTTCYKDFTSTGNNPITTAETVTLANLGITLSSNYNCTSVKIVEHEYSLNENVKGYQYVTDIVFTAKAAKTAGTNQLLGSMKRKYQTDAPEKALLGPYNNISGPVGGGSALAKGYGVDGEQNKTTGDIYLYIYYGGAVTTSMTLPIKIMGTVPYIATL